MNYNKPHCKWNALVKTSGIYAETALHVIWMYFFNPAISLKKMWSHQNRHSEEKSVNSHLFFFYLSSCES